MRSLIAAALLAAGPALAQDGALYDPAIRHAPKDGVVSIYGAGGPEKTFQAIADLWQAQTGHEVRITFGPEKTWSAKAQADADMLWGTSEQSMTAFLQAYPAFSADAVQPIYLRPAIIAVKAGNPKGIQGFDDLLKDGTRIVVTEGAGVANTSGTGVWEDVAGLAGKLSDVAGFRRNIVAVGHGSGASFKAFKEKDADAWITWPEWPVNHPDVLQSVSLAPERTVWRDINVVLSPDADPEAKAFLDFLTSEPAQELARAEGWAR